MEEARPNSMRPVVVNHRDLPPVHGAEAGPALVWLHQHSSGICDRLEATPTHRPKLRRGFAIPQLSRIDRGEHD
ncbi:MAG: hypothetical protein OEV52_01220 [Dehalococcoidia bacterium]|nr:hypothetical protein [Dehalococcoidia bacterium]MDH4291542.1 hypothetical protein [Dehalococcoidia bacterium]